MTENQQSSGVDQLIQRLSKEGVAEGERRAHQIVEDGQRQADATIKTARRQADELVSAARTDAERLCASGEEALRLAIRDAVRDLESQISDNFRERLRRLVEAQFQDSDILTQLIREIVAKSAPPKTAPFELLLPTDAIQDEKVKAQLESGDQDALTKYVRSLVGDTIREGISLGVQPSGEQGLTIRVVDDGIEIDLTPDTIRNVLESHLLPRFRSVMRHG